MSPSEMRDEIERQRVQIEHLQTEIANQIKIVEQVASMVKLSKAGQWIATPTMFLMGATFGWLAARLL